MADSLQGVYKKAVGSIERMDEASPGNTGPPAGLNHPACSYGQFPESFQVRVKVVRVYVFIDCQVPADLLLVKIANVEERTSGYQPA